MSFVISKVAWILIQPSNLILFVLIFVAAFAWKWPVLTRRLLWATVVTFATVTLLPVGQWLSSPVEQRFPELTDLPPRIDGIIVLGGAVEVASTIGRKYLELNSSAERMTVSADLAKRHPDARLVYSGYKGRLIDIGGEIPDIVDFYVRQGIEPSRILFEGDSRNTYENAIMSMALAKPTEGEIWLLVTSAYHMPRAFGIFQKIGWPVVPMPVDFRRPLKPETRTLLSDIAQPNISGRLQDFDHAVRAWVGLIAYRLTGRTTALLPGP